VQVRGLIARGGQAFLIFCPWFVRGIGVHCLAADGRNRHRLASMAGTR